jgi:hypothetical protein
MVTLANVDQLNHLSKMKVGIKKSKAGKRPKKTKMGGIVAANRLFGERGLFDACTILSTSFI